MSLNINRKGTLIDSIKGRQIGVSLLVRYLTSVKLKILLEMVRIAAIFLLCWCLVSGEFFPSEDLNQRREHFLENVEIYEQAFEKEFAIFLESGLRTKAFNETLKAMHLGRDFLLVESENMPPELAFMSCAGN